MASSTPPPHCSISSTTKVRTSYQQNPPPQTHNRHNRQQPWNHHTQRFSLTNHQNHSPTFPRSELSAHFSGRRSTRFVSKLHFGRPKASMPTRHSFAADEALQQLVQFARDDRTFENILLAFEPKLSSGSDDFIFLLREFGNKGDCFNSLKCFHFAIKRETSKCELGKLATAMISVLGRFGQVDFARRVFDTAVRDGYGNTVYAYSALISAYGRSGCCDEAIRVFESMKMSRLKPNLVTYNAVIDACGKGGVEFKRVTEIFEEMSRNGVQPDRITYNSLLAVCSRHGSWEAARNLFGEMIDRGIDQDIFTYNTLLDAVCKGGQMDLASEIMAEMPARNILPNVVTYSTMIDGYAKAGRPEDALGLFYQMKCLGIVLDRVSYNTLLSLYAKLGRFEEALDVCREMEISGIRKDVVTYNALLGGYGKQGKYEVVRSVFKEMKAERVSPNLLTYSTVIDVYSKGGLYREAMEVYKEFKQSGLKADVVLYSALIDALCKSGLVQYAVILLDEMTKEGIRPNVVTYNSIIDAFGRSAAAENAMASSEGSSILQHQNSSKYLVEGAAVDGMGNTQDNQIIRCFTQLASEKAGQAKKDSQGRHEFMSILGVFRIMHELKIKPNVVTFSAILNACSRCNSLEDASMLLEELHLFDNQVYGVAHGLLMGCHENIWAKAQSLFDQVREMDTPTASAFYNALTDVLWHFGQRRGAQLVVLEGKRRQVWENVWSNSCLDLHLMSSGAAQAMVHAWLLNIRSVVFEGHQLPKLLSILTGWGKHSKVVGDSTLRRSIDALLMNIGAPFQVAQCNLGRFISTGPVMAAWLRESETLKVLVLHDDRTPPESFGYNTRGSNLHALTL